MRAPDPWTALGDVVPTDDGSLTLRHPEHGECYHSTLGASAEADQLYLKASGIELAFASSAETSVLDVGLGLGYNALATLRAWLEAHLPGALSLVSLEVNPELVSALASGRAPWQANWDKPALTCARSLHEVSPGQWRGQIEHASGARATWLVRVGDAHVERGTFLESASSRPFDFVWQDPFSPEKNPALWTPEWFAKVRAEASEHCTLMTYSVARRVRDALDASGWRAERIPTSVRHKRHWLRATPRREAASEPI